MFKGCKTVLILGEGDLSFTHAMLTQRHRIYPREPFKLVLASTYDSHGAVKQKYPTNYIEKVKQYKSVIMKHNVDATILSQCIFPELQVDKHQKFDAIIFNYPHTGEQRTHLNRNLLRDVFCLCGLLFENNSTITFFPYDEKFCSIHSLESRGECNRGWPRVHCTRRNFRKKCGQHTCTRQLCWMLKK